MIKVGVIGATGYAGVELIRLLLTHPNTEIVAIGSSSQQGQLLDSVYPSMTGFLQLPLCSTEAVIAQSDVVFASLPHGLSQPIAAACKEQGKKLIDLGADFRLESEEEYQEWYGESFDDKELHTTAVYGLPELFRKSIQGSQLVANPGCYPTSVALGLAPLLQNVAVKENSILIDAKSGVTGAGKVPTDTTHFPQSNENIAPYKIGTHRHTPEIEQSIRRLSGTSHTITFTPHLIPVNRGILSTIYVQPVENLSLEALHTLYGKTYQNEPFVRVMELGKTVSLRQVQYSNYCDISLHEDKRTGRIIIAAVLDNMIKGAAGQAIQNMNLLCGINEASGLSMAPPAF